MKLVKEAKKMEAAQEIDTIISSSMYACIPISVYLYFPPEVVYILPPQSDWSLSCDHGLDYASRCENNKNNQVCVLQIDKNWYTYESLRRLSFFRPDLQEDPKTTTTNSLVSTQLCPDKNRRVAVPGTRYVLNVLAVNIITFVLLDK